MSDVAGWVLRAVEPHRHKSVGEVATVVGIDQNLARRALAELEERALVVPKPLDRAPGPRRRGNRRKGS